MTTPTTFLVRLTAAFALALIATVATALLGFQVVRHLRTDLAGGATHAHRLAEAHALRFGLERAVATSRGYAIAGDAEHRERALVAVRGARDRLELLPGLTAGVDVVVLAAAVQVSGAAYLDDLERLLRVTWSGRLESALAQEVLSARWIELEAALAAFVDTEEAHAKAQFARSHASAAHAQLAILVLGALASVLVAGAAGIFGRRLARAYRDEHDAVVQARRALATRDDLLAVIAHDLRNPLGAILVNAGMLREAVTGDQRTARLAKQAAAIERTTMRMNELIQRLLDAATIEAGRFTVQREPRPVRELIAGAVEVFEPLATARALRLTVVAPAGDVAVAADRERIDQVLSNLLGNAVKLTPAGGEITLRAEATADAVRLAVTDTGPGIAPEHVPHLFTRYWKHDAGGKRGTGLGLFIAHGIVAAHGGELRVETKPGQGTTFWFTLPRAA